jgi:hypothetical protein
MATGRHTARADTLLLSLLAAVQIGITQRSILLAKLCIPARESEDEAKKEEMRNAVMMPPSLAWSCRWANHV